MFGFSLIFDLADRFRIALSHPGEQVLQPLPREPHRLEPRCRVDVTLQGNVRRFLFWLAELVVQPIFFDFIG
jgi:hypothetical protein